MKSLLKRIQPLYSVNARFKARKTKAAYRELCLHYERLASETGMIDEEKDVSERLREHLSKRGLVVRPLPRGSLAILYVGTDQDQDTAGFLQTLGTFGRVYRFLQEDGSYGHCFGDRLQNGRRLIELVKNVLREGRLHMVLGQMWGHTMPWQALEEVRRMGVITVNISMDDRHTFVGPRMKDHCPGTKGLIPGLDLDLTSAPEACLWYALEGCPALFWPQSSDPSIFHPMCLPKKHDVSFVGTNYGIRAKVVRAIRKRGINVECFGRGWPNGRIPTKDVPELFARSKIVLGIETIGHCGDFYSLKTRDFDATMSGSMYLTHANPDLNGLFDIGKEIVCYRTTEECADRCEYYLSHEDEREAIARAGLARSLRDHTWEARLAQLFRLTGLLL